LQAPPYLGEPDSAQLSSYAYLEQTQQMLNLQQQSRLEQAKMAAAIQQHAASILANDSKNIKQEVGTKETRSKESPLVQGGFNFLQAPAAMKLEHQEQGGLSENKSAAELKVLDAAIVNSTAMALTNLNAAHFKGSLTKDTVVAFQANRLKSFPIEATAPSMSVSSTKENLNATASTEWESAQVSDSITSESLDSQNFEVGKEAAKSTDKEAPDNAHKDLLVQKSERVEDSITGTSAECTELTPSTRDDLPHIEDLTSEQAQKTIASLQNAPKSSEPKSTTNLSPTTVSPDTILKFARLHKKTCRKII